MCNDIRITDNPLINIIRTSTLPPNKIESYTKIKNQIVSLNLTLGTILQKYNLSKYNENYNAINSSITLDSNFLTYVCGLANLLNDYKKVKQTEITELIYNFKFIDNELINSEVEKELQTELQDIALDKSNYSKLTKILNTFSPIFDINLSGTPNEIYNRIISFDPKYYDKDRYDNYLKFINYLSQYSTKILEKNEIFPLIKNDKFNLEEYDYVNKVIYQDYSSLSNNYEQLLSIVNTDSIFLKKNDLIAYILEQFKKINKIQDLNLAIQNDITFSYNTYFKNNFESTLTFFAIDKTNTEIEFNKLLKILLYKCFSEYINTHDYKDLYNYKLLVIIGNLAQKIESDPSRKKNYDKIYEFLHKYNLSLSSDTLYSIINNIINKKDTVELGKLKKYFEIIKIYKNITNENYITYINNIEKILKISDADIKTVYGELKNLIKVVDDYKTFNNENNTKINKFINDIIENKSLITKITGFKPVNSAITKINKIAEFTGITGLFTTDDNLKNLTNMALNVYIPDIPKNINIIGLFLIVDFDKLSNVQKYFLFDEYADKADKSKIIEEYNKYNSFYDYINAYTLNNNLDRYDFFVKIKKNNFHLDKYDFINKIIYPDLQKSTNYENLSTIINTKSDFLNHQTILDLIIDNIRIETAETIQFLCKPSKFNNPEVINNEIKSQIYDEYPEFINRNEYGDISNCELFVKIGLLAKEIAKDFDRKNYYQRIYQFLSSYQDLTSDTLYPILNNIINNNDKSNLIKLKNLINNIKFVIDLIQDTKLKEEYLQLQNGNIINNLKSFANKILSHDFFHIYKMKEKINSSTLISTKYDSYNNYIPDMITHYESQITDPKITNYIDKITNHMKNL